MSNPLDMCCKTTCDPKAVDEWIEKKDARIAVQAKYIKELEGKIEQESKLGDAACSRIKELEGALECVVAEFCDRSGPDDEPCDASSQSNLVIGAIMRILEMTNNSDQAAEIDALRKQLDTKHAAMELMQGKLDEANGRIENLESSLLNLQAAYSQDVSQRVAVYDLTPAAERESLIAQELVRMGWTPPEGVLSK